MATVTQTQPADTKKSATSRASVFVALLLLLLMFALAGGAALRESVTFDELAHISAGVSYWQKFDMRLNGEHPPLAKLIAALPLVLMRTHVDYSHPSWTQSDGLFNAYLGQWIFGEYLITRWNDPVRILFWSRLPMLLLTLALGWVVFVIARRIASPWGGVLALSAYVAAPVFLTFGPLVLTDIAITLFSLLALWMFAELWQQPSRRNIVLFGLSLAGALLSKFSAGILFIAFAAVALSMRWLPVPGQPIIKPELKLWHKARHRALLKGVLLAAVVVYVTYLVFSWNQNSEALSRLGSGAFGLFLRRLLMPPLLYLRGMFMVVMTGNRPAFLLGQTYPHGTWLYFPVLLLLKSTLGFLGLVLVGAVLALYSRLAKRRESVIAADVRIHWRVLWVALVVFVGLCLISHVNIGYRHFSVSLVLMSVMLAPIPNMLWRLRGKSERGFRVATTLTVVLALSSVVTVVRQYPFFLPYTNPLTFGRPAYTLMSDSNLDWNQALPEVARFAQQHGVAKIKIDEMGYTDMGITVRGSELWDCQVPMAEDAGQWVFVSADLIVDIHNCRWLTHYPHQPIGGGSMYAFQLPSTIPEAGTPGGPPAAAERRLFFGLAGQDMRLLFRSLVNEPDKIADTIREMQKAFEKMMEEQKRKKVTK